jgi:hypothetical protein
MFFKAVHKDAQGRYWSDVGAVEYVVGRTYSCPKGGMGFNACKAPLACFVVYDFDIAEDALMEVELGGDLSTDGTKWVGPQISILREITGAEKLELLGTDTVISTPYGGISWYSGGVLHRDNDMPASISIEGNCEWFRHGLRHRDGNYPAVLSHTGECEWWVNGVQVSRPPACEGCEGHRLGSPSVSYTTTLYS